MIPDIRKTAEYAKKYNRIPLYRELNMSSLGFTLVLKALEGENDFIFLESAKGKKGIARFSYLCFNPSASLIARGGTIGKIENSQEENISESLFEYLENQITKYTSPNIRGFGDFNGGYTGYIAYEAINRTGILRSDIKEEGHPCAELLLIDDFIVYDNVKDRYYIATAIYTERGDLKEQYSAADLHLQKLESHILNLVNEQKIPYLPSRPVDVDMNYGESDDDFKKKIMTVKNNIEKGEIIQAVISRRMYIKSKISPYRFYMKLRSVNPSPYMYLLKFGKKYIAGCSPETHIKIKNSTMHLKPIAGTAPIPDSPKEKREVRREMMRDPKERAEHLMLVDLARNDLSRIAERSTVVVKKFMKIEDYSHVMHIVSKVQGKMKKNDNIVNAFKNTFPAGTVSGAPKVRAIELIDELEDHTRGAYAGTVGYFGFNGSCDTCITIRTAFFDEDSAFIQAGAGIVYDSVPEKEIEEINNKLMALTKSMGYAV